MSKTILKILILPSFLLLFCEDNSNTSKELRPTMYRESGQECYNVVCYDKGDDTVCYRNPGTPQAAKLPKSSICYKCLHPDGPPSNTTPQPPVEKAPTYQLSIEFPDSLNKKYGYDPALGSFEISISQYERRISYFSIKKDGCLQAKVTISPATRKLFSSFYLKIGYSTLSFDSIYAVDSVALFNAAANDTVDTISIYGRQSSFMEVPLFIGGINRSGKRKMLVCNDSCDEAIMAKCYDERVIDSLRIYRINKPPFNPEDSIIKVQFNNILKQAIVKIKAICKQAINNTVWDNNNNNILDLFPNTDSVPNAMLEHVKLLQNVEASYSGCNSCWNEPASNQEPKIFILPSTIQRNWILLEDAHAGSDTILVQYSEEYVNFLRKDTLLISTWDGTQSEKIILNHIVNYYNNDKMCLKLSSFKPQLSNSYPRYSVLIEKGKVKGFTHKSKSCAFIENTSNYRNIIHEYLHTARIGPLSHANFDTTNLMFGGTKYNGTMLRYRMIETSNEYGEGFNSRQWEIINND